MPDEPVSGEFFRLCVMNPIFQLTFDFFASIECHRIRGNLLVNVSKGDPEEIRVEDVERVRKIHSVGTDELLGKR